MRITLQIDDRLLASAKKLAAESGKTLSSVLEDSLRESLARRNVQAKLKPVRLKTVTGGGLRAGVDLDSAASLAQFDRLLKRRF